MLIMPHLEVLDVASNQQRHNERGVAVTPQAVKNVFPGTAHVGLRGGGAGGPYGEGLSFKEKEADAGRQGASGASPGTRQESETNQRPARDLQGFSRKSFQATRRDSQGLSSGKQGLESQNQKRYSSEPPGEALV